MPLRCLFALLLAVLPSLADEVELKNGAAFSGRIVAEDETSITIRLDQGGTLTFEKSQVSRIRRGELDQPGAPTSGGTKTIEAPPSHDAGRSRTDVEQGPLEDLVARVGPGGVQRRELDVYLLIWARDHGKEASTPEERRQALDPAIVDELIFQAALAEGALEDDYTRWKISTVYKSYETTAKVDPREITEDELRAYYDAHLQEFTEPGAVRLEGVRLDHASEEETEEILSALERGETPPGGFQDQGWMDATTPTPMDEDDKGLLLALVPGEVSPVLEVMGGLRVVYRCAKQRAPRQKSFEESRERARFLLLGKRVGDKAEELNARLEGQDSGGSTEDKLYREALRKGYHRRPECRPYIINAYLDKKKQKKVDAAAELRSRFAVEVLLRD